MYLRHVFTCTYLSRYVRGSQWQRRNTLFIRWVVSVWALWTESPNPLVPQAPPTPPSPTLPSLARTPPQLKSNQTEN